MLQIATRRTKDDIVLDFFAGSGTTGTSGSRAEQPRRRQSKVHPRPTAGADARPETIIQTIADITKERVRRVIKNLNDEDAGKLDLKGTVRPGSRLPRLQARRIQLQDMGCRVAARRRRRSNSSSNSTSITSATAERPTTSSTKFCSRAASRSPRRSRSRRSPARPSISVAGGALLICLERELTLELIRAIADMKPERVVCLDEGFAGNDQLKANAVQTFKTKGVTSFKTV